MLPPSPFGFAPLGDGLALSCRRHRHLCRQAHDDSVGIGIQLGKEIDPTARPANVQTPFIDERRQVSLAELGQLEQWSHVDPDAEVVRREDQQIVTPGQGGREDGKDVHVRLVLFPPNHGRQRIDRSLRCFGASFLAKMALEPFALADGLQKTAGASSAMFSCTYSRTSWTSSELLFARMNRRRSFNAFMEWSSTVAPCLVLPSSLSFAPLGDGIVSIAQPMNGHAASSTTSPWDEADRPRIMSAALLAWLEARTIHFGSERRT